jgi:hypothetical protein
VALVSFLPIYLQSARGLSPGQAGLLLLPLSLGGGIGGLTAGRLMAATGLGAPDAALALVLGLASIGVGASYPVSQITVQVAAGPARLGSAAAAVQFARSFGAAAATALLGALLFGALAAGDPRVAELFAALVRDGAPRLLPGLDEAERLALRTGLSDAFRIAFLGAAALLGLGAAFAWRVPVRRL